MTTHTKTLLGGAVLVLVLISAWGVYAYTQSKQPAAPAVQPVATTSVATSTTETPATTHPATPPVTPSSGSVTLHLNETGHFSEVTFTPLEIVEDSRCPVDVQCIQAGTVRVSVGFADANGTMLQPLTLNKPFITDLYIITLTSVTPTKNSKTAIGASDYRLTFDVEKRAQAKCYIGGCSSQVCSDTPGAVSTCVYNAAYACYRTATCERQSNGACGWTQTPALQACLAAHPEPDFI